MAGNGGVRKNRLKKQKGDFANCSAIIIMDKDTKETIKKVLNIFLIFLFDIYTTNISKKIFIVIIYGSKQKK